MKKMVHIVIALVLGFTLGSYGLPLIRLFVAYYGSPQVTLINLTGQDISNVRIGLAASSVDMQDMKYGHSRTVCVTGQISEASTHITWTDNDGTHATSADDYVEGCGWYHTKIAILGETNAKAIYEIE